MQIGSNRQPSPWWHNLFWIPVGICVVVAGLFLFGVLPPEAQADVPEGPAALSPPPEGVVAPLHTPEETLPPSPTPIPLPESTPVPENMRLGKPVGVRETAYRIVAELSDSARRFTARMQVNYTNTTGDTLYELVFHLPGNAYAHPASIGSENELDTYPNGFEQGGAIIGSVMLDGSIAYFNTRVDEQLLVLPFVRELLPGESTEVFIDFVLDVPTKNGRFGKTELGYQLGNCWPILAVYQDGAWVMEGYQSVGDPYYSEIAEYTVSLTYPDSYRLACVGEIVSESTAAGRTTTSITGEGLREFACMLTTGMQLAEETHQGIKLRAFAVSETSLQRSLQHTQEALTSYLPHLGNCPYGTLTIVQADMQYAAGMEYPGMIFVQRDLFLPGNEQMLAYTIAHEIAHQWFYGLVGSDQINAPWIDESLASFLGFRPLIENNPDAYLWMVENFLNSYQGRTTRIAGSIESFRTQTEYELSVYWRGVDMYDTLLVTLGSDVFYSALSIYLQANAGGIANRADILYAFEQASGRSLAGWFDQFLGEPDILAATPTTTE